MSHPRYFIAVFGEPSEPRKSLVDSGVYGPNPNYAPFPVEPGDLILLYCTAGYQGHQMEAPGVGVVLSKDLENIRYRWIPFSNPVPKHLLDRHFEPEDAKKFGNIRFSSHWLFEISHQSFSKALGDRPVAWAKF